MGKRPSQTLLALQVVGVPKRGMLSLGRAHSEAPMPWETPEYSLPQPPPELQAELDGGLDLHARTQAVPMGRRRPRLGAEHLLKPRYRSRAHRGHKAGSGPPEADGTPSRARSSQVVRGPPSEATEDRRSTLGFSVGGLRRAGYGVSRLSAGDGGSTVLGARLEKRGEQDGSAGPLAEIQERAADPKHYTILTFKRKPKGPPTLLVKAERRARPPTSAGPRRPSYREVPTIFEAPTGPVVRPASGDSSSAGNRISPEALGGHSPLPRESPAKTAGWPEEDRGGSTIGQVAEGHKAMRSLAPSLSLSPYSPSPGRTDGSPGSQPGGPPLRTGMLGALHLCAAAEGEEGQTDQDLARNRGIQMLRQATEELARRVPVLGAPTGLADGRQQHGLPHSQSFPKILSRGRLHVAEYTQQFLPSQTQPISQKGQAPESATRIRFSIPRRRDPSLAGPESGRALPAALEQVREETGRRYLMARTTPDGFAVTATSLRSSLKGRSPAPGSLGDGSHRASSPRPPAEEPGSGSLRPSGGFCTAESSLQEGEGERFPHLAARYPEKQFRPPGSGRTEVVRAGGVRMLHQMRGEQDAAGHPLHARSRESLPGAPPREHRGTVYSVAQLSAGLKAQGNRVTFTTLKAARR